MMDTNRLNELLLTVQKPGRYIGNEWNAVRKEWTDDKVKVLLAFPDTYEVGMSYLGIKILYGILNERGDALCERVFAPWHDFEGVLRKNAIPLYSLESKRPIRDFDIIGFSLAYELTYTNALTILDLGGIPLRASERGDDDPIIIAGGPSCYNPEPMAEFIDAFVIGDGEESIAEIVETYTRVRSSGGSGRQKILRELAGIRGVYVPSLYAVDYNTDGTIRDFKPREAGVPERIRKVFVKDLDAAYYPVRQIVPNIGIVHDRIAIEIMRGCVHACKFCQATMTYRPCRERSPEKILDLARRTYGATGYDEISLLSLSSIDYPHLGRVIEILNNEFCPKAVSLSVPSLRVEEALKDLPVLISKVKKAGLTFAPEAGTERMRALLNKNIRIERLYEAAKASYRTGWRRMKLYYMFGLPGETDEDIVAIGAMAEALSGLKKEVDGRPADVTASVNAFVPKPHTAFQREAMDGRGRLEEKRAILRSSVRSRRVVLDFHSFDSAFLEAVLSRGDRRISAVIHEAWKAGARFDAWTESFKIDIWRDACGHAGIDPAFYANRRRSPDEILPWSFIDLTLK